MLSATIKRHPVIDVPVFGHLWEATWSTTANVVPPRASELLIGTSMWLAKEPGRPTIPKQEKNIVCLCHLRAAPMARLVW